MTQPRWVARANFFLQRGRPEQAEREVRAQLVEDPEDGPAHSFLALCLRDQERYDEALESAVAGVRLSPDEAYSQSALALVHRSRGDDDKAERAYRAALDLDPETAHRYTTLADLLLILSRPAEALTLIDECLRLDAVDARALRLRSLALLDLSRGEESDVQAALALAAAPDEPAAHYTAGRVALRGGDAGRAAELFAVGLRASPRHPGCRDGLVQATKTQIRGYRWLKVLTLRLDEYSSAAQFRFLIAAAVLLGALVLVAARVPGLAPYIAPGFAASVSYVVVSWLFIPLSSFVLSSHSLVRPTLSPTELERARWIAFDVALLLVCAAWFAVAPSTASMLAIVACAVPIPCIVAMFDEVPGPEREFMSMIVRMIAIVSLMSVCGALYFAPWSVLRIASLATLGLAGALSVGLARNVSISAARYRA